MTAAIYPEPGDVGYSGNEMHVGLRVEAQDALRREVAPSPKEARDGQVKARSANDDEALALWSRLRVRALVAVGDKGLSL